VSILFGGAPKAERISENLAHPRMNGAVYSNGSDAHVDYTKMERELIEKLKIDL
jgi:hypothetical protein